jgi:hypothetical protein
MGGSPALSKQSSGYYRNKYFDAPSRTSILEMRTDLNCLTTGCLTKAFVKGGRGPRKAAEMLHDKRLYTRLLLPTKFSSLSAGRVLNRKTDKVDTPNLRNDRTLANAFTCKNKQHAPKVLN